MRRPIINLGEGWFRGWLALDHVARVYMDCPYGADELTVEMSSGTKLSLGNSDLAAEFMRIWTAYVNSEPVK